MTFHYCVCDLCRKQQSLTSHAPGLKSAVPPPPGSECRHTRSHATESAQPPGLLFNHKHSLRCDRTGGGGGNRGFSAPPIPIRDPSALETSLLRRARTPAGQGSSGGPARSGQRRPQGEPCRCPSAASCHHTGDPGTRSLGPTPAPAAAGRSPL